ncbi:MAG: hypothetical protein V4642_15385 [Bacteroidota bacterium]
MTADKFVKELEKLAPEILPMIESGLDEDFAFKVRSLYLAPPRNEPKTSEKFEILNLIFNYHANRLQIRQLTFFEEPEIYEDLDERYYGIGYIYPNYLLLDTNTGDILINNLSENTLLICASSCELLFDALIFLVEQQILNSEKEFSMENEEKLLKQCSVIAGSIDYLNAWEMI